MDVLCDVRTPFEDAARVFGPQKGADPALVRKLSERLDELASSFRRDPRGEPMTGAAGGLSGALWAEHGARLQDGPAFVLGALGFDERMREAAFVVTGEGRHRRADAPGQARRRGGHALPPVGRALPRAGREDRPRPVRRAHPRLRVAHRGHHARRRSASPPTSSSSAWSTGCSCARSPSPNRIASSTSTRRRRAGTSRSSASTSRTSCSGARTRETVRGTRALRRRELQSVRRRRRGAHRGRDGDPRFRRRSSACAASSAALHARRRSSQSRARRRDQRERVARPLQAARRTCSAARSS